MWAWNKVALLQKVLRETPPQTAPWILYMRPDTMINDITITYPFEMYKGRHWVSVGDTQSILDGWASGELLHVSAYCCKVYWPEHGQHLCDPDIEAHAWLGSEGWNTRAGIDTGVFLIRNSPFIRELLDTLERQARILPMPSAPVGHFTAQGIHR